MTPGVSEADLKTVYNFYGDLFRKHPDAVVAVPPQRLREVVGPNADLQAISSRATLLRLLLKSPFFSQYLVDGQPSDKLFYAAARFPLEELPPDVAGNLDTGAFLKLLNDA